MKINWYKIASAAQLLIGVAAIVAFFCYGFRRRRYQTVGDNRDSGGCARRVRNNGDNKKEPLR